MQYSALRSYRFHAHRIVRVVVRAELMKSWARRRRRDQYPYHRYLPSQLATGIRMNLISRQPVLVHFRRVAGVRQPPAPKRPAAIPDSGRWYRAATDQPGSGSYAQVPVDLLAHLRFSAGRCLVVVRRGFRSNTSTQGVHQVDNVSRGS